MQGIVVFWIPPVYDVNRVQKFNVLIQCVTGQLYTKLFLYCLIIPKYNEISLFSVIPLLTTQDKLLKNDTITIKSTERKKTCCHMHYEDKYGFNDIQLSR